MAEMIRNGPNVVHPETPSAVGSRNSLYRDGRDETEEARTVINEQIDKILNHISNKLPPEVLKEMDVMGGLKEKLYNYINQDFQNMFNRYTVTMEDEMTKKARDLVDREEMRGLASYSPREISELVDKIGSPGSLEQEDVEGFADSYQLEAAQGLSGLPPAQVQCHLLDCNWFIVEKLCVGMAARV